MSANNKVRGPMFWTSYAIMAVGMALMVKPVIDGSATGGAVTPMQIAGIVVGIVGLLVYAMVPNKMNSAEKKATEPKYAMPRSKELNDLLLVYNTRRPNGMTVAELNGLYALTAQSGEKVDETISKIHRDVKYERDRRKNGTPQTLKSSTESPQSEAERFAYAVPKDLVDRTPDKVKKAQRKAGVRCPKCGSTDIILLNNTKSSLSAGKAIVGDVVAGVPGMAVGAIMGKKGKREYLCNHCGKRYSVRN